MAKSTIGILGSEGRGGRCSPGTASPFRLFIFFCDDCDFTAATLASLENKDDGGCVLTIDQVEVTLKIVSCISSDLRLSSGRRGEYRGLGSDTSKDRQASNGREEGFVSPLRFFHTPEEESSSAASVGLRTARREFVASGPVISMLPISNRRSFTVTLRGFAVERSSSHSSKKADG